MSGNTIPLTKPVKAHDQEIQSLVLREVCSEDILELGFPFLIHQKDGGTAIELRPKIVSQYLVRLASVPPSAIKQLQVEDLMTCQAVVLGFFGRSVDEVIPT